MAEETASITQACPNCGATIDTSGAEPLARIVCPQCQEKVRVERAYDHFVLLETLGIGGMGTVYKARDTLLDREVAIKLLREDLGTEFDHAARLQHEARVAASVNHPNVIQVFSSGTDHGKFYLVMELVDRGSLDDFIEERKQLPEELVVQTAIQVAKGLRAAYAKGLIHRDVKPANILFADENMAKIGDFGLAGVAAEKEGGEIWGTPYYVAPERLKNEPEDFRSDIFSLGATLFHALSGRAPIEGETNSAVALLQLKEHPVDLSKAATGVSSETARVFQRMIAPDPAKRFSSYDELVEALERAYGLLTGTGEFVGKKRARRWVLGSVVLAVALIAVGAWALITHERAKKTMSDVAARAEQLIALAPLEAQMTEARRQLVQGHHNVAGAAFAQVALDAKGRQPLYDWARLQQGLAALVARESSQARQVFQDVQNAGERGFASEDIGLARFFMSAAKTLTGNGSIAPDTIPLTENGPEAFALLLFGMKDASQLDAAVAAAALDRFVNAKPVGKYAWIADYRPVAQKYLDDCHVYLTWKNQSGGSAPVATRLDNVRRAKGQLKVKGTAISDELGAEERRLSSEAAQKQNAETAAKQQEQKARVEQAGRKRPEWLAQWRAHLISDLNTAHYSSALTDINGVQYSGIAGASEQGLKMKLPYGEAELPWAKLPPRSLLAISESFVRPGREDAADRQWLCAVYASETGQADEAKRLAEAAGKLKPEYQEQAPVLFGR